MLRAARTVMIAVPSATLGALAHSAAGGCLTVWSVALVAGVLVAATWTQLTRERSGTFLLAWLGLGQLVTHGLLELGCTATHPRGSDIALLLHAGAVLLTAVLLRREEARIWAAARWLATVLRRFTPLRRPVLPTLARPVAQLVATPRHRSLWASPEPVRRGPPRRPHRCA